MKNAKKVILSLSVVACMFAAIACGKKDEKKTEATPTPTQAATQTVTEQVTPTEAPRDLKGLEVTIYDWWTEEGWDDETNAYQTAFFDMLHQAEKDHNFKFTRVIKEFGWGNEYQEAVALSITDNNPKGSIITLDNRWVAALLSNGQFLDVSKCPSVDWNDSKWNYEVKKIMTVNGGVYGFAVGCEARTGVFFNKDIFKTLGVDANTPYDLQKEGKWSWDEFKKLCAKLTKDTDNDGVTDIYAVAGQDYLVTFGALQSNGTFVIDKDANGFLKVNADDPNVLAALNFVRELHDDGYFMPTPGEDVWQWDWFKTAFAGGFNGVKTAMRIEEEWVDTAELAPAGIDFGYVCYPYGPAVGKQVSICRENILFVPSCEKTKSVADDIMYAYNWYTTVPEGFEDDDARWKAAYQSKFEDQRAVDETIRLMCHDLPYYMYAATVIPNFSDGWTGELERGATAQQVLEAHISEWQTQCDEFNAAYK